MKLVTKIYKFGQLSKKSQQTAKGHLVNERNKASEKEDRKYAEAITRLADPLAEAFGLPLPEVLFQGCLEETLVSINYDESEYMEFDGELVETLACKLHDKKLAELAKMLKAWDRGIPLCLCSNLSGEKDGNLYVKIDGNEYTKHLEKVVVATFKKLVKEVRRLAVKAGYDKVSTGSKESEEYYFLANGELVVPNSEQSIEE